MASGFRVVRGPDWNLLNEDGGDGHLGTVTEVLDDNTVMVTWDMGSKTKCRAGKDNKHDLLILDNAPAGVRFASSTCGICETKGFFGMKWNCLNCEGVCLCSVCYAKGEHDEKHPFLRYFSPGFPGVKVSKRFTAQKQRSLGIFPGGDVVRGPDWQWENQDGGTGEKGNVIGLRSFGEKSAGRNAVAVTWQKTKITRKYRVGFEGKVDLQCKEEAPGFDYYKDHLPVLDQHILTSFEHMSSLELKVKDQVCVGMSASDLKEIQEGHGGWTERMRELPGRSGTIEKFTKGGDAVVIIGTNKRVLNTDALVKVHDISVGDIVKVADDRNMVMVVQEDHGGWVDDMNMVTFGKSCANRAIPRIKKIYTCKDVLGKVGEVVRITPKNDIVVAFGRQMYVFHPACCIPAPGEEVFKLESSDLGVSQAPGLGDALGMLLAQMLLGGVKVIGPEQFLQEAARGNVEIVGKILSSKPELANAVIKGTTALILASHEGRDTVVQKLLSAKANTELADGGGNTPLLAAVVGKKLSTTALLLDNGANINHANGKGRTAIHIASNAGHGDLVRVLLHRKCDVNAGDILRNTPLHNAIFEGHNSIVVLLVAHEGIDFTKRNAKDMNTLQFAAFTNNPTAVDKILEKCKNMADVKKNDGFTALHLAAFNNHILVASHLIVKGSAEIDIRNDKEQTPLHLAASRGFYSMVKLLLDNGADVSAKDKDGDTALHTILRENIHGQTLLLILGAGRRVSSAEKVKIGCLLVTFGAKIDVRNNAGKTPIDVCDDLDVRRAIVKCADQTKQGKASSGRRRPTSGERENTVFRTMGLKCIECFGNEPEVTYEPCKHKPHCLQCSFDFDECPVCNRDIVRRTDKDGNTIIRGVDHCGVQ